MAFALARAREITGIYHLDIRDWFSHPILYRWLYQRCYPFGALSDAVTKITQVSFSFKGVGCHSKICTDEHTMLSSITLWDNCLRWSYQHPYSPIRATLLTVTKTQSQLFDLM